MEIRTLELNCSVRMKQRIYIPRIQGRISSRLCLYGAHAPSVTHWQWPNVYFIGAVRKMAEFGVFYWDMLLLIG